MRFHQSQVQNLKISATTAGTLKQTVSTSCAQSLRIVHVRVFTGLYVAFGEIL